MYFKSAPLQKTPPSPRRMTARTFGSRASCSPALRKSLAVETSRELKRSRRSIVRMPTAPSLSTRMWDLRGEGASRVSRACSISVDSQRAGHMVGEAQAALLGEVPERETRPVGGGSAAERDPARGDEARDSAQKLSPGLMEHPFLVRKRVGLEHPQIAAGPGALCEGSDRERAGAQDRSAAVHLVGHPLSRGARLPLA